MTNGLQKNALKKHLDNGAGMWEHFAYDRGFLSDDRTNFIT
jgi:hypothetical protein